VHQLAGALRTVATGGSVVDPIVVEELIAARRVVTDSPLAALTEREQEVLAAMAEGLSNAAIAARTFAAERTVEKHINTIFTKLQIGTEPERQPAGEGGARLPHRVVRLTERRRRHGAVTVVPQPRDEVTSSDPRGRRAGRHVGEPVPTSHRGRVEAGAVVVDAQESAVAVVHVDRHGRPLAGVLGRVLHRLDAAEVDGRLDLRIEPGARHVVHAHGAERVRGDPGEGVGEAAREQQRREDPMGERAQLPARVASSCSISASSASERRDRRRHACREPAWTLTAIAHQLRLGRRRGGRARAGAARRRRR
jgi:DNA-binding CsgD family transcriptional regulator